MPDPWNFTGESVSLAASGGTVTLVEGSTFCISGRSGDIVPGTPQGLIFRDTRFLSRFELRVNGRQPEPLSVDVRDPFTATFVARTRPRPGRADSTLLLFRDRFIGRGMREDIRIRNYGEEAAYCAVELAFDADFADVFDVKQGTVEVRPEELQAHLESGEVRFEHRRGVTRKGARISFSDPSVRTVGDGAVLEAIVPARGEWHVCVQVTPSIDGETIEPRHPCGEPVDRSMPAERMHRWRRGVPVVDTDHGDLARLVARSTEDLGALRIFDPDFPERTVVAAGAPWFMTLFGRDSLLTSWMALLVDPDLALGVLQTLARFQGEDVDPRTEEEPGRILHEVRFGDAATLSLGGGRAYYGTADATPLFVMLLGELRRWGLAREAVDALTPHAERALRWIEEFGDRDGDGYVEYQRATDRGLQNQGWKDSWDGVRFADGRLATPPIALAEVQAYVYGAYLARAHFAFESGDAATAERYREKAHALKVAFNRDFWLEDRGWFAMALDCDKRPVDALASNMGHCLWTGIVDEDKAPIVAANLVGPELFSGWGVRTLAVSMTGYNPISYHNGSVWPHDNALAAAGLVRYGFVEEAHRIILAMVDAASHLGHRLPELFAGIDRREYGVPVSYPTSCSPQAWAAASPLLFLRMLLRFDPWVPHGKLWLDPVLPSEIRRLRLDRIPLAGARLSVAVEDGEVSIEGLPPGVEVVRGPRPPLTEREYVG